MRKFLIALALLLGVSFLLTRFAQLSEILEVLQRGNFFYLGLALLVELVWIYNLGAFYQSVYHVLGMEEKRLYIVKLVTAGYFLTVVAPSGGLSAMAVYIADAQRNGRSTAKVTVAGVIYIWFEYIGTLTMLVLGLGELSRRNNLHWSQITASLILLLGALGIGLLLYLGMHSASALGSTLAWLTRLANAILRPFLHHNCLEEEKAYNFSREMVEGIKVLRNNPGWIMRPLLFTLINRGLLVGILWLSFLAFSVPVDIGTIIAGQSVAHLFLIVSPTPAGIGIVEGILAVALNSLGIPLGDATVITLAYRGFSFWMPLLFGMITFRSISSAEKSPTPVPPAPTPVVREKEETPLP